MADLTLAVPKTITAEKLSTEHLNVTKHDALVKRPRRKHGEMKISRRAEADSEESAAEAGSFPSSLKRH